MKNKKQIKPLYLHPEEEGYYVITNDRGNALGHYHMCNNIPKWNVVSTSSLSFREIKHKQEDNFWGFDTGSSYLTTKTTYYINEPMGFAHKIQCKTCKKEYE